jgi:cysteine desulfurase
MTPADHRIYLDWNATAPLLPAAREAMLAALDAIGNPSSVHAEGRRARALVEQARDAVATLVGAAPADVVFTSGATEANNLVLAAGWDTLYASPAEHDSVHAATLRTDARRIALSLDRDGVINADHMLADVLAGNAPLGRALLSLQLANSETGVVQPVLDCARFASSHGVATHTDATQAAGRLAINWSELGVDFLTLSAHKLGGPKGVGALVVRAGANLPALLVGGGQERRRRAGTENVAAIAGFGVAARAAMAGLADMPRIARLRDRLEQGIRAVTPTAIVVGSGAARLANTSCIALPGRAAETQVIRFDLAGFAVSAGSACTSGKVGASRTLAAIGLPGDLAASAIRISIGPTTSEADIAAFLVVWRDLAHPAAAA